jgi:hypothetical protein
MLDCIDCAATFCLRTGGHADRRANQPSGCPDQYLLAGSDLSAH